MKKNNNYSKEPLLILNELRKKDPNLVAFFAFGSFVTQKTSLKCYKEIRIFNKNRFLVSIFKLASVNPDIDLVYVSTNIDKSLEIIKKEIIAPESYYFTINIITPEVFESEVFSSDPKALRRIMIFRELLIIKGKDYLEEVKARVVETITPMDTAFQNEFDFRKDYLKLFAKYNVEEILLNASEYSKLFPLFYQFISGKISAGFPELRHKYVCPETMKTKYTLDIEKASMVELE